MCSAENDDPRLLERLERMLYREFLIEKDLYLEVGLDRLPAMVAVLIGEPVGQALASLVATPELDALALGDLARLVRVHDMVFLSRTAAGVAHDLKQPGVVYERCIREALSFAVSDRRPQAFAALRAASVQQPQWARHHFIYGLLQALVSNNARALRELGMALEREPYEDARGRIRVVMDAIEKVAAQRPGV